MCNGGCWNDSLQCDHELWSGAWGDDGFRHSPPSSFIHPLSPYLIHPFLYLHLHIEIMTTAGHHLPVLYHNAATFLLVKGDYHRPTSFKTFVDWITPRYQIWGLYRPKLRFYPIWGGLTKSKVCIKSLYYNWLIQSLPSKCPELWWITQYILWGGNIF